MALQTLCNGGFTDEEGNPLANGYLDCLLSHDEQNTSGPSQVVAGIRKKIFLDNTGNAVVGSQLFANDAMNPTGSYYEVMAHKNDGTRAWKYPQYVIVTTSISCFNLSAIIPTNPPAGESNIGEGGLLLQTNGTNNSDQNLLNIQQGTNISITNVAGTTTINSSGSGLPAGQIGDGLRYNVNGDSKWDAVNYSQKTVTVFTDAGTGVVQVTGATTEAPTELGAITLVVPTATDNYAYHMLSSSSASTSTVIGVSQGTGGNYGLYGWGGFYRWSLRTAFQNTTNVRYWAGLSTWLNGGSGGENAIPLNSVKFATNNPNCSTLAFRYSVGTDTAWQATAQTTGGSQTVTSTGVSLDTNIHLFEITYDGTTARYFIDTAIVASITTNVPNPALYHMYQFYCGDNLNTATAISANFYWMTLSLK
jgi:hypothetical protein